MVGPANVHVVRVPFAVGFVGLLSCSPVTWFAWEASAAMLATVMLKFAPARSMGMRSPDCAGTPEVNWEIFSGVLAMRPLLEG